MNLGLFPLLLSVAEIAAGTAAGGRAAARAKPVRRQRMPEDPPPGSGAPLHGAVDLDQGVK